MSERLQMIGMSNMDVYAKTVERLEPAITMIDEGAFNASAAISLKRIADSLQGLTTFLALAMEKDKE
jgi:hypothetical protein